MTRKPADCPPAKLAAPPVPVALSIAGSDCSGGAGIQADLKTFTVLGVYGAAVLTAITAQNTTGVKAAQLLEPDLVQQQIESVACDLPVQAAKTGMLGSAAMIETVANAIRHFHLYPLVVDPVMLAKSGDALIDDAAVEVLCDKLLPLAALVTPNRHEAARLLGQPEPISTLAEAAEAATEICRRLGARACVVKGIQRSVHGRCTSVDVLCQAQGTCELVGRWCQTRHTHGSGCTFSAAITAGLAKGQPLTQAVQIAKELVCMAIANAPPLGHGNAPVNPLAYVGV